MGMDNRADDIGPMRIFLEIDVSIKAVRLNPIKLASDARYWIVSMSNVLVDGNVVTTDTHERIRF